MFCCLMLSNVNIFPKVTIRTKNATLKGVLALQVLFYGSGEPIDMINT
jgi:hypothetical protein